MHKTVLLLAISILSLSAETHNPDRYIPLDVSAVKLEGMEKPPSTEKIAIPELTALKRSGMKTGESETDFLKRIRALTQERQDATFETQKRFRDAVLQRNKVASSAKVEFDKSVVTYNRKLAQIRHFLDYDARVHGVKSVSKDYPQFQDVSFVFDDSMQDPNLNDPYLPLLTSYSGKKYSLKNDELHRLIEGTKKVYPDYKSWLFVVSIEEYADADRLLFATRTSQAIVSAFQKKLGIPSRHIIKLENEEATGANIMLQLEKMIKRVQPEDTIYFYFVGHATSGPSGDNFILAYDGSADMPGADGLVEMERIYNVFQRSRAGRTFAFIDASFTGVSDNIPLKKGETERSPVNKTTYHKRLNIINAANRDQTANAYFEKGYRLFSYFLIQGALSGREQDAGEMFDDLQLKILQVSTTYGPEFTQEPEFFGYRNLAMQK